jgi:hypothetical protein
MAKIKPPPPPPPVDDYLTSDSFTIAELTANDPTASSFKGVTDASGHLLINATGHLTTLGIADGITSDGHGDYTLTNPNLVIQEEIKLSNGTIAFTNIWHPGEAELISNYNFNTPPLASNTFDVVGSIQGWSTASDSGPVTIAGDGSYNIFTADGTNWIETSGIAGPGNVDISTQVALSGVGQLSITLGPALLFGNMEINPNATLDLTWNGTLVHEFTLADFTDPITGQVSWNTFQTFTYNVTDNGTGTDTVGLHDTSLPPPPDSSPLGFAVDTVSLQGHPLVA